MINEIQYIIIIPWTYLTTHKTDFIIPKSEFHSSKTLENIDSLSANFNNAVNIDKEKI